ncbi:MAG: signal peptide peptidase SppA [Rhodothermales bacterium]
MRFFSTLLASILGTLLALGLVFFIGFLFLMALAASSSTTPVVRSGSVLVLNLAGPIPEQVSDDPFAQAFGGEAPFDLYDLKRALQKAAVDDRIDGAWLQLRGVSASWGTLQEIREALLAFKESGKPLIASSDEYMMAEDEYFLASATDSVFASPEAFFEFNGFYMDVMFFKEMLDKLDVEAQIVRAGKFKGAVEPFFREDLSEANKTQLSALLESHNSVFLDAVADSRGRPAPEFQRLIEQQASLTTAEAYDTGLLDGLLFEDQVANVLKERLGLDEEDKLRRVGIKAYARVPASEAGLKTGNKGEIAVVYAVGTILSGKSASGILGSVTFNKAMREARESKRVKAVVLRINSPGGSASASDAMWREISLTAAEKPVIVSMGDVAASGGYWIATAADTIVADPQTITGSIGVFSLFFDLGTFLESKIGITTDGVRTSTYADMFSGMRPLSDDERAVLQRSTDATYRSFLKKVADSRGLDVAEVDSIGQGRVWTGAQALEIGLVDILGDMDTAIRIAAERAGLDEGTYRTRLLPKPRTFMDDLNDALSAGLAHTWQRLHTTPVERTLVRQMQLLEQLVEMQGTVQARLPMDLRIH